MTENGTTSPELQDAAAYGTFVAWDRATGHGALAVLLQQTLGEEKAANEKLSSPVEGGIDQSAADTSQPGDEGKDDDDDDDDDETTKTDDEDDDDEEDEDESDEDDEKEAGTRLIGSGR